MNRASRTKVKFGGGGESSFVLSVRATMPVKFTFGNVYLLLRDETALTFVSIFVQLRFISVGIQ